MQCNTNTVPYSTVQCVGGCGRVRGEGGQSYSTVQYSTVQYSTVQYSTVQYSTVQYKKDKKENYRQNKNNMDHRWIIY